MDTYNTELIWNQNFQKVKFKSVHKTILQIYKKR